MLSCSNSCCCFYYVYKLNELVWKLLVCSLCMSYLHLAREDPDMSFVVAIVIVIMYKLSLFKFDCLNNTL